MIGSVSSNALVQKLTSIEPFGTTIVLAGRLMPIVLVSFVFAFVYVFVTNTKVKISTALFGGAIAGIMWALTGKIFASFVVGSTKYAAIYSSFAILIIALLWLYLNWMILLLGAQIAFYVQHPEYLRIGRTRLLLTGRERETLAVDIMLRIGERFMSGPPPYQLYEIASAVGLPEEAVAQVAAYLERSGLIERTDVGALVPGRDLAEIRVAEILGSVREPSPDLPQIRTGEAAAALLDRVEKSFGAALGDQTLRDLVHPPDPESA
jgi:membrane protein